MPYHVMLYLYAHESYTSICIFYAEGISPLDCRLVGPWSGRNGALDPCLWRGGCRRAEPRWQMPGGAGKTLSRNPSNHAAYGPWCGDAPLKKLGLSLCLLCMAVCPLCWELVTGWKFLCPWTPRDELAGMSSIHAAVLWLESAPRTISKMDGGWSAGGQQVSLKGYVSWLRTSDVDKSFPGGA